MIADDIVLSLDTDEMAVLPETSSIEEFLAHDGSCRTQLLPEMTARASAISKGTVGPVAGSRRPDWWDPDPSVTMQSVNLFRVRGAHYFPAYGVLIDRMGRAMRSTMAQASYVTPDLLMLPHMRKVDQQTVFSPPKDFVSMSRAAVSMPWGAVPNYGHFVIDCLMSVAMIQSAGAHRSYDFIYPPLKPWHREHLALLGVAPIELPHKYCYVEDAVFTDCMGLYLRNPNRNLAVLPARQRSALGCSPGRSGKIYVSRRGSQKRVFLSEDRLESLLAAKGFRIVQPETLSVRDQISLFAGSAVVVGCAGAALANAIYCPAGAVVVEILPRTMEKTWVRNLCLQLSLKWAPYFCDSILPEKPVVYGGIARPAIGISFDVDPDDFIAYVDRVTNEDRRPFWRRFSFWK